MVVHTEKESPYLWNSVDSPSLARIQDMIFVDICGLCMDS